jgi:exoribonuclease R
LFLGRRNVPNETDPGGKSDKSRSETMILYHRIDNSMEETSTLATSVKPDKGICNLLNTNDTPTRNMDGHSNLRKSVISTDASENDLITVRSGDCSSSSSAKQQNDTSEVQVFDISEGYSKLRISPEPNDMQEEITFYQQSCMYHNHSCEDRQLLIENEIDEKIMKYGVKLNQSFENKTFEKKKKTAFYTEFLAKEVMLQNLKRNPNKYVKCRLKIEGAHQAYCHPVETDSAARVIEISGRSKIGRTFNDDEVVVEILDDQNKQGKCFGKVVGIYNRQRHKGIGHPVFICTVDTKEINLVKPLCKTVPKLYVSNEEINKTFKSERTKRYKIEVYEYDEKRGAFVNPIIYSINPTEKDSHIFLVAFINWDIWSIYPRGVIIKVLPVGNNMKSGLMILNYKHEIPTLYEKETIDEVSGYEFGEEPSEALLRGRTNLTGLNVFTIDPPESRDLDDALSIEKTTDGYKVGVHIADVSTFVLKDTALDQEALQRGMTFYSGIHRPQHMLPEPISCNVCSLLPQKVRLTISVFLHIADNGVPVMMKESNFSIVKSFIKSRRRLTYSEAQSMICAREATDAITNDVKSLFDLASKIRNRRLGNAMFAIGLDWEEICNNVSKTETVEAHYLVEEFMIMTNERIAQRLLRSCGYCVPLRCQPPPSQENINTFCKKNDHYADIVLRFQDKLVGNRMQSLYNCLERDSRNIKISKSIWEAIIAAPKSAGKLICTDELHPFQLAIINDWLEIQEKAGYKCSESLQGNDDGKHFDLQMFPYTHFTSPLRRYNDLVVHRLVHAAVFQRTKSPYSKEEIDSICTHLNAVAKRSKAYEKGCSSLKLALELKSKPKMIHAYVEDVSDGGVVLCSPVLKYVSKHNRRLMFNLLDMGYKPQMFTDPNTSWETVKATWRKRLYSIHVKQINNLSESQRRQELQLNANKGLVLMPLSDWAKILKCVVDERFDDMSRAVKNAHVSVTPGLEDVTTECLNPSKILANTMFSLTYSRGQQIKIQMTTAPYKGVLAPRPILYNMTNNVKFCLQHTDDPVSHLYRYVTKPTCEKYQDIQMYLETLIPIIQMESTMGAVNNPESYCLNDVPVYFTSEHTGTFSLGLAECEVRNIELSGTYSDGDFDTDGSADTYDWLCLKTVIPNRSCQSAGKKAQFEVLENVWVGHANVVKVKKTKNANASGTLTVNFQLHEKAPHLPPCFHNLAGGYRFSVEILRKTEVDR